MGGRGSSEELETEVAALRVKTNGLAFCCPDGGGGSYFSLSLSLGSCFCLNKEFNGRRDWGSQWRGRLPEATEALA